MIAKTLTAQEVRAIYDEQVSLRPRMPDGFDPKQAARVLVHVALQARNPPPCSSLEPDMLAARNRREPLTQIESILQVSHQRAQVTKEQHAEFSRAMSEGSLDAKGCADTHHFVQKKYGIALWAETDRLLKEAKL